jgi:serine/threonine protein kinase
MFVQPERIDPPDPSNPNYDIRADVWSLGITLVELATGKFPYGDCHTDFEVLTKILKDDPPSLPKDMNVSDEFRNFVDYCLIKDYKCRPKYSDLLKHPFIQRSERSAVDVRTWYNLVIPSQKRNEKFSSSLSFQSNPMSTLRHSGRMLRSSTAGSPSPSGSNSFVTTPGSARPSRYEEFTLPSPNRRTPTPSTPGTPSPNTAIPPEPPPR